MSEPGEKRDDMADDASRNGEAGSPSLFIRFGSAARFQPNRTAAGLAVAQECSLIEADLERLKQLHWMRCPKCGLDHHSIRMRNVDVDACLSCGGFWLDKGELEKLEKQPMPGAVAAFLNWFKEERKAPGKK